MALSVRREILTSSFYRKPPHAALHLIYARWRFSRAQPSRADPISFLGTLGIDSARAMSGFGKWRPALEEVVRLSEAVDDALGVSLPDGIVLYGLVRALHPDYVIETGIGTGVSTSFLSAALLENESGLLYSIDLAPKDTEPVYPDGSWSAARGPGWAVPSEIRERMSERHKILLEDVRVALPRLLAEVPRVDLFLHDDLHIPSHVLWEFREVWPHLSEGGVLAADDINSAWIEFCRSIRLNGKMRHLNLQRLGVIVKKGASHDK